MRRIHLILMALMITLSTAAAAEELQSEIDSLINRCIDATFTSEYVESHKICDRLEELVDGPMSAFYRSALLAVEMVDFEDTLGLGRFYAESQRCIDLAQRRIDAGNHIVDDYFYLGSTYAYRALFLGHHGSYWAAYRSALKSRDALERCLEMDSTYVDARVGLGNFQYWMSRKLDVLNWLPVLKDEKDEGIAQLERAVRENARSKYIAISSLANIHLDQGNYGEALQLAKMGKLRYPGSRTFLWQEGAAAMQLGLYSLSNRIYQALLLSVTSLERNNHYNEISCYASLVISHYRLKDWDRAMQLAEQALAIPLSDDVKSRKKHTLAKIRYFLELAQKKLSKQK